MKDDADPRTEKAQDGLLQQLGQSNTDAQLIATLQAALRNLTTENAPVSPIQANDNRIESKLTEVRRLSDLPEWISVDQGCEITSMGKTRMYDLLNAGDVHSVVIRNRGCIRGMRRIHTPSLIEFMANLPSK